MNPNSDGDLNPNPDGDIPDNGGTPGGEEETNPFAPEITTAAEFAVKQINAKGNFEVPYVLKRIISATKQVVAGTNYKMQLEISSASQTETHNVVVYERLPSDTNPVKMELTKDEVVPRG